jgi:hypothetical protein
MRVIVNRRAAFAILAGLLAVFLSARQAAATTLEEAVAVLSDEVIAYLQESDNPGRVSVKEFEGDDNTRFNLGVTDMFRRRLKEKVQEAEVVADGIEFAEEGDFVVSGEYSALEAGDSKFLVRIEVKLLGSSRGVAQSFQRHAVTDRASRPAKIEKVGDDAGAVTVDAPASVGELTTVTTDLTKPEDKSLPGAGQARRKQDERLAKAQEQSQAALEQGQTLILAGPDSPYRLEILAWDNEAEEYLPLEVTLRGKAKNPEVALQAGQLYAIKVHNEADFDCAVRILIDGVNTLAYSEVDAYRERGVWMIPAGETGLVQGFHHRNVRGPDGDLKFIYHGFLVTELPDQELKEEARKGGSMGIISATFFPAWQQGQEPPQLAEASRGTLGTAPGEELEGRGGQAAVAVDFGTPLAIISVRYTDPNPGTPPKDLPPG